MVNNNESFAIELIQKDIVLNSIKEYCTIDINEMHQIKNINERLTEGGDYCVLVAAGKFSSITKEARELSASENFQRKTIAKALIVSSLSQRMITRFYIRVNKPSITTKIFAEKQNAIDWLKTQLHSYQINPAKQSSPHL